MKKRVVIAVNVEEDSIISRLEKLGNDADKLAREARRLMFELESDEENAMQNKLDNGSSKRAKNIYGLSEEKVVWLKEIGAFEFQNPIIYGIPKDSGISYTLSEKYLKETPLDKLKSDYSKIEKLIK